MERLPLIGNENEWKQLLSLPVSLLLVSVLGSLGMAAGSLILLGPEDRISVARGSWLALLGLVFFVSLYDLLNYVALRTRAGNIFRKKYELTLFEVLDISNKTVSAVQAVLSCLTGSVVCIWSCTRNFLRSSHFMSEAYAWFGAAYFFYDIWSMYQVHTSSFSSSHSIQTRRMSKVKDYIVKQPMILLHHIFIGSFGFLVIVYLRGGLGDCVFGFVYLMELSTPFVSFRGILSRLKMKASTLYFVNGLVMLVTFFFCRVMMFPYVCYLYSQVVGLPFFEAVWLLPSSCKIGIGVLMLPQIYWFLLMLNGAFKVFAHFSSKQEHF
ncbi:TLC domain-containing protein 3A [Bacillus rossius redtenbacheri]|uniref:TLC domain-containing protein 3A n=1 Tax=Bacillus rossius redtenbacheri TaxID=93214 RepID=UPI002FDC938B